MIPKADYSKFDYLPFLIYVTQFIYIVVIFWHGVFYFNVKYSNSNSIIIVIFVYNILCMCYVFYNHRFMLHLIVTFVKQQSCRQFIQNPGGIFLKYIIFSYVIRNYWIFCKKISKVTKIYSLESQKQNTKSKNQVLINSSFFPNACLNTNNYPWTIYLNVLALI